MQSLSNIGVVAIGRNEGERLRACLASAHHDCTAVVYVDSGSTDGSVELAISLGVHVVELDLSKPFTAARARNEGIAKLLEFSPSADTVQFVDGDCEIVAGWIEKASAELSANPKAAVICGRRRERFPRATVFNQLCDMEWDTPIGIAKACGGDALIRVSAFQQVGGYNPDVIAGEEPEMCVRLREKGWTIHRINAEMTLHDAAITRFSQWWKRNVRAGHAYAEGNFRHGGAPEFFRQREVSGIWKWAILPLAMTCIAVVVIGILSVRWSVFGLLPLLLYPLLAIKVAKQRMNRGTPMKNALLYGSSVVVGKFPQLLGLIRFRSKQRRGERSMIIEYKR
jgi:glycosyltransferase involved in cell wall biosynthesis